MSDEILKKSKALTESLVKDVKSKLPAISKMKQMAKLAAELDEPVPELDDMIETAELFANMVIKRFDKTVTKE